MVTFLYILNLISIFASTTESCLPGLNEKSQELTSILNRIILEKKIYSSGIFNFYGICNTTFDKINKNVYNSFKIHYLKLRENILANVLLLDSTQKKNFDNKLINALVGLDKVLICESSLEDRIKIMLAFSDFNFQKNLTKLQV